MIDAVLQRNAPPPSGVPGARLRVRRNLAATFAADRGRAIAGQPPAPIFHAAIEHPAMQDTFDAGGVDVQIRANARSILEPQRIDKAISPSSCTSTTSPSTLTTPCASGIFLEIAFEAIRRQSDSRTNRTIKPSCDRATEARSGAVSRPSRQPSTVQWPCSRRIDGVSASSAGRARHPVWRRAGRRRGSTGPLHRPQSLNRSPNLKVPRVRCMRSSSLMPSRLFNR